MTLSYVKVCKWLFLLCGIIFKINAQQNLFSNQQVWYVGPANIASAGIAQANMASLTHRKNWTNFSDAPSFTQLFLEASKTNTVTAFGFYLSDYEAGAFKRVDFKVGYRKTFKLKVNSSLSFGLRTGWHQNTINTMHLRAQSPEELASLYRYNRNSSIVFDLGLVFTFKTLTLSISSNEFYKSPSLTQSHFNADNLLPDNFIQMSYGFQKENWMIKPILMARSTYGLPLLFEAALSACYKTNYTLCIGLKSSGSYYILLEGKIYKRVHAFYGYEFTSNLSKIAGFSNEIGLTFFPLKK